MKSLDVTQFFKTPSRVHGKKITKIIFKRNLFEYSWFTMLC